MQIPKGLPLHQSLYGGIVISCPPELSPFIEEYFNSNGLHAGHLMCFSTGTPDKLSLIFELATQTTKLAGVIMGLLNRNDIEIEMYLSSRGDEPKVSKVKLRHVKDAEACERLIDKLSAVVVTPKQDNQ